MKDGAAAADRKWRWRTHPNRPPASGRAIRYSANCLRKLVATLPEAPRMVMVLRYQEDLEPAEIAAALEMPVATVKSHLQRSLALPAPRSWRGAA